VKTELLMGLLKATKKETSLSPNRVTHQMKLPHACDENGLGKLAVKT